MPKLAFSHGTLVLLLLCAVVGCGALEQPTSPELATTLRIRLAEPPPDGILEIGVGLDPIPYCPAQYGFSFLSQFFVVPEDAFPVRPFDGSASTMELPVRSGGQIPAFGCTDSTGVPFVRFFQPAVFLLPVQPGVGFQIPWRSRDTIIAYTDEAMTFVPFGPTDQPIALQPGYSVLRRTCGSLDQSWQLQISAPEDPIDFYPPTSLFFPQPLPLASALLEQSERALLEGCGIQPPPPDPGKRVSFDRAVSLAFSANAQELFFLLPIDPADPAQGAALRSINLADGSVRQIGIVPDGRNVQTSASGEIYIATETNLIRVTPQPDERTLMTALPINANGRVSPDGRWIAYWEYGALRVVGKVWDVVAGVAHPIDNPNFTRSWSPASLLVAQEFGTGQPGTTYDILAPASGQLLDTFHLSSQDPIVQLSWGADGPVGLVTPTLWVPERQVSQSMTSSNRVNGNVLQDQRNAGLVLEDPRSGGALNVLDANAGSITFAAGTTGKALLWARKCLGLFDTVCSFDLHQVTVPAGNDQVVAVADSAALVAITPSGDRIAIAARDGIYVRDLP